MTTLVQLDAVACGATHCLKLQYINDKVTEIIGWATAKGGNRFGQLGNGTSTMQQPHNIKSVCKLPANAVLVTTTP